MTRRNLTQCLWAIACLLPITSALSIPRTSSGIQWSNCTEAEQAKSTLPMQCGLVSAPLDYTNSSSNITINVEVTRIQAISAPSKGSLLFNFGGPGLESRSDLAALGPQLLAITGGSWDLVAMNTRGTGKTLPISCYANDTMRALASAQYPVLWGNASDTAVGTLWAGAEMTALSCETYGADAGPYMGTPFVARDMARVVDALGEEDGMLRFWGFSYGTILGATFAALFPTRVGRIILDGVVNWHEWYDGYDAEMVSSADATVAGFFTGCAARPSNCILAQSHPNATGEQLQTLVYDMIEDLKYAPVPWPELGAVITYTLVKSLFQSLLYSPTYYPGMAMMLDGLVHGNLTEVGMGYAVILGASSSSVAAPLVRRADGSSSNSTASDTNTPGDFEALLGTKCSDKSALVKSDNLADVLPGLNSPYEQSKTHGDLWFYQDTICARWKMASRENFTGPWTDIKTSTPLMLIGNTFDPATPLKSAMNVSASFEGSAVLQQDGYGHSSLSQPSICTAMAVRAYLENSTLPEAGTICEVDTVLYDNKTWVDIFVTSTKE